MTLFCFHSSTRLLPSFILDPQAVPPIQRSNTYTYGAKDILLRWWIIDKNRRRHRNKKKKKIDKEKRKERKRKGNDAKWMGLFDLIWISGADGEWNDKSVCREWTERLVSWRESRRSFLTGSLAKEEASACVSRRRSLPYAFRAGSCRFNCIHAFCICFRASLPTKTAGVALASHFRLPARLCSSLVSHTHHVLSFRRPRVLETNHLYAIYVSYLAPTIVHRTSYSPLRNQLIPLWTLLISRSSSLRIHWNTYLKLFT